MKMVAPEDSTLKGKSNLTSSSGRSAVAYASVVGQFGRAAIGICIPKRAPLASASGVIFPELDGKEDHCDITKPSGAQVTKQADIDARRTALTKTEYSDEKDPPKAAKIANSRGKKSAGTKPKKPTSAGTKPKKPTSARTKQKKPSTKQKPTTTTKEARAAALVARQLLVCPSPSNPSETNVTSTSTASQQNVSINTGMSIGTPAEGERVPGTVATTSRKKSKSNAKVNVNAKQRLPVIGPGKRCKMKRKYVFPLLAVGTAARQLVDSLDSKEYNLYGSAFS